MFRLCLANLEQAARSLLLEESNRATQTIRALERLMKGLASTGQPVTLVLISESMVISRDPSLLAGVAEACAEARVSLHVVQPALPVVDMSAGGFASDPTGDDALRREGLELLAAQARGAFHRAVSTGADVFDRIGREVSGYYLLGIEPAAEDRRRPRRRVDVQVHRRGLTVRARSMFALDARAVETPIDAGTRLRNLLEAPVPQRGVPIRVTARTLSADADRLRVLIAAEIGEPTDQQATYHVGLIAIDGEGGVKARSAASTLLPPARSRRQAPSLFTTSVLLEPGDYSLRLAVVDETGRAGSVHHNVRAVLREWPRGWRTSDLIAANQPGATEFPPFNASSIVETASVAAVIEVLHEDASALEAVGVRFEIDGVPVEGEAAPAARHAGRYARTFSALVPPPATGEHRLRAVVSGGNAEGIVLDRAFYYDEARVEVTDPSARGFIEALERQVTTSASLTSFVAAAKAGQFVAAPDAETRSDADLAMVTFVNGLAAMRDGKTALARALFQQTLRKAPGFEGAQFYLALLK